MLGVAIDYLLLILTDLIKGLKTTKEFSEVNISLGIQWGGSFTVFRKPSVFV
jgi:hypothetical protein